MKLPLVIEIVDAEEAIRAFLPVLDGLLQGGLLQGGLVTLERVEVVDYRARSQG